MSLYNRYTPGYFRAFGTPSVYMSKDMMASRYQLEQPIRIEIQELKETVRFHTQIHNADINDLRMEIDDLKVYLDGWIKHIMEHLESEY